MKPRQRPTAMFKTRVPLPHSSCMIVAVSCPYCGVGNQYDWDKDKIVRGGRCSHFLKIEDNPLLGGLSYVFRSFYHTRPTGVA